MTAEVASSDSRAERIQVVRQSCLACTVCDLSQTRTQVVFGEGNPQAPLVIVGEGPGEQEDATGRPFVGRAGALLEECLRLNGIGRRHVWITNTLKCRACTRQGVRMQNRPPTVEETGACHSWLEQELQIIQPSVILCLGSPAANWVIHPGFAITRERGRFFPCQWAKAAIAALHPAYVLRQSGIDYDRYRDLLIQDIGLARQKVIELKKEAKETSSPPEPEPAPDPTPQLALEL